MIDHNCDSMVPSEVVNSSMVNGLKNIYDREPKWTPDASEGHLSFTHTHKYNV